jgi:hypothetical protein
MKTLALMQPKIPFQYQMTTQDCVPTTILNALRYLFPREVIPPAAVALTNKVGMDEKSCWWSEDQLMHALNSIVNWLNRYDGKGRYRRFRLRATILQNEAVTPARIAKCFSEGQAAIYMGVSMTDDAADDHATLAIYQDAYHTYFFDSYLSSARDIVRKRDHERPGFHFFQGETKSFNVKVPIEHLYSGPVNGDWYYRLGDKNSRFCILFETR